MISSPCRRRRYERKFRRLVQAAVFAAVRGAASVLGGTVCAWLLYLVAQHH